MSKKTTNILGIVITILAGIYFYVMCCNECVSVEQDETILETGEEIDQKTTFYLYQNNTKTIV